MDSQASASCQAATYVSGYNARPQISVSPGGVIGSRKGLKIPRRKLRTGSSPVPGTSPALRRMANCAAVTPPLHSI